MAFFFYYKLLFIFIRDSNVGRRSDASINVGKGDILGIWFILFSYYSYWFTRLNYYYSYRFFCNLKSFIRLIFYYN